MFCLTFTYSELYSGHLWIETNNWNSILYNWLLCIFKQKNMFIRSCQLVATGFQSVYKFVHSIQYVTDNSKLF